MKRPAVATDIDPFVKTDRNEITLEQLSLFSGGPNIFKLCSTIFVAAAWTFAATAADWPAWRGPNGDGKTPEKNLPLKWSADQNVLWRTPLPEPGNSTPIVSGGRVFVTQPVSEGNRRTLMFRSHEWHTIVAVRCDRPVQGTAAPGKYLRIRIGGDRWRARNLLVRFRRSCGL